jgi:hypothetical protein
MLCVFNLFLAKKVVTFVRQKQQRKKMNYLSTLVKHAVSQNRSRFIDGQYDLDLTYITNRIIG